MRLARIAAAGLAAAGAVGSGGCAAPEAAAPVPAVTRDPASGIAEAVLPNGLKVLVLERPGIPVVSHQIWYRVGSVDERPGETGLAHYLEHVLFKGTREIDKGEIDLVTFRAGGANNATTWNDYTSYYFNFEASRWRLALEIESDRMRNCTFVPKEFEAERGAVLNELHASHDSPGGRLDEEVDAAGYTVHPYHHPTIGWRREVESVPRSRVIAFYDRYYAPDNAVLVVVGAVKAEEVVAAAAEAFAEVERGPAPPPVEDEEPVQRGEKRVLVVEDTDTPRVEIAWHTCRVGDDDDFVLDVASAVLGTGKSSRLYRRLVEVDRTCTDVSAWNETRKYPGRFKVWADGQQDADPRAVEAAILEEVARLAREGPTDAEVEKARNNLLARDVYARETVAGTADRIGSLEIYRTWRVYAEWPDRIRAVTAQQVKAAAARYFTANNRTVGWSVSPKLAVLASPHPPGADPSSLPEPPLPGGGDARARKADPPEEPDARPTFRGGRRRPLDLAVDPRAAGVVLDPKVATLPNGMTLILQPREGLPVVTFNLFVNAGQLTEARPGLAWLVGDLLDEGAGGRSSEEIAETLDFLGAALATGPSGARAKCLSRDAATVLDLLADVILRPAFREEELEKVRAAVLSEIAAEENSPAVMGRKAFLKALYGDHPYGRLPRGDAETMASLAREEVLEHWSSRFVPGNAILAVTGEFDPAAMEREVAARFGEWEARPSPRPELPSIPERTATVRIEVPMEGKNQSNLFVGNVAIRRNDPDYAALLVLDHILGTGPGFSDRLSRDLRDEQGLAYTVSGNATRSAGEEPGAFTGFVACLGDDLDRALEGMLGHIRRIREEPVSDQELADAKSYLAGSQVFAYETTEQLAIQLVDMQRFGLGFDYPARFPALVNAVRKEDVLRVARGHLHPDRAVIVVSGFVGK